MTNEEIGGTIPTETALKGLDMEERAFQARDRMKDYAWRCAAILRFLRANDGECLGDHPDWIARIDALLNEKDVLK
jgi:hypothetical protein